MSGAAGVSAYSKTAVRARYPFSSENSCSGGAQRTLWGSSVESTYWTNGTLWIVGDL